MNITITGASGLIGRRLMKTLLADGHSLHVLSRHVGTNLPAGVRISRWDPLQGEPPAESLASADAVIHLAGESVAQRWTADAKKRIADSRIIGTRHLVQAMSKYPVKTLINASAIGYYGDRADEILTEASSPGTGFLPEVCVGWEKEARAASARVVLVRIGVVLDARGGALAAMLPPFRVGVGGKLGSGAQWMSWIHADDLVGLMRFALTNSITGPVNGVAPNPVTNAEFTKVLGATIHRPTLFPMPKAALGLIFGEMAEVLVGSARVLPKAAEAAGFACRFPQLAPALADVLK